MRETGTERVNHTGRLSENLTSLVGTCLVIEEAKASLKLSQLSLTVLDSNEDANNLDRKSCMSERIASKLPLP